MKKFGKKRWILIPCLIVSIAITLIAIGFIPVKRAVYADKETVFPDENGELKFIAKYEGHTAVDWFRKNIKDDSRIVEAVIFDDRAMLKQSGRSYIGEHDEYYDTPVYYEILENSPLSWLNTNFNPDKVKNYFAIRYYDLYWIEEKQGEMREGYYNQPIVIKDWTPTYPIQRSGWLASRILPKDYLVIWDFIGWRACW